MHVQSSALSAPGNPVTAPASEQADRAACIRALNDRLRHTFTGGRVMITRAVQTLADADRGELLRLVQAFDQFDAGNDPYGDHDFGRIEFGGAGYYFKIDYYDTSLEYGSPDPADDTVTTRVMTIMREDEY